ncbi:zinc finger homeobox protein 2 [Hemicordylus capensis]|uniref:zinc finger homeobox protein 2 n=1 Tax=Hemicordylus capensis TaxID=884348 RepID=UPI002304CF72|nr:zinc finger homeobox protein 2 [Hemicordylus capensis]XP_053119610.1 zinc finger homeobox protein 2 [Hemicordylus capensis]XP_053119611.1 zinc finger homeobox protein 2 [Hemicordylus capensis]XP_053119612.1 zinc finger homeobox protein 2 [Hemicordylus capensis]XP_053119614.1 zinc finger homeobox protein 2 [Hemicordylus capensis]
MDAPSNSASSFCSSAAVPPADGQDDRAVVRPAQDSPASPATKEPPLSDPASSPASPSPDETMRPGTGSQAAFSSAKLPATILSTPQLQAGFGLGTPNPSLFPQETPPGEDGKKEEADGDGEEEEDGGNEAQLFFSVDGSAYLLSGGHVLLPKGSPSTTTPPVSILHVQCGGGPNQGFMSTDQMSQNTSAPDEWSPHGAFYSYRLAGAPARTTSAKNAPTKPKDAPTAHAEDEEDPQGEANLGQEEERTRPPIWLCLRCRLSFHRGRSLATHICVAHGVQLSTSQCQALSRGASAAFQGTTVGFLEPNNPTTKADLNARMCSRWVNVKEEKKEEEEEEEEEESPEGQREPPDAKDSRVGGAHWVKGGIKDKPEREEEEADKKKAEGRFLPDQSSRGQSPPTGTNPSLSETPQMKANACDITVNAGSAKEDISMELANQVAELANEAANVGLAREVARAESAGDVDNAGSATKVTTDGPANSAGLAPEASAPELAHSISNVGIGSDIAGIGFEVNNGVGNNSHNGAPPLSFGEDFTAMAYSGLTLSGHMSLLHSRNSCKTLKCPKCNWHYKYQQTLDVHMKEKHPENNSHCAYCSTGGPHPRLARGESYNCGYKPYRCEACNYSTTTKGNLSIHMQSDKHLANLQGYQATGGSGAPSAPPPAAPTPSSPEEKEAKGKSSWQCKVCSYETNISRNLRIHMTSEKHMQNMLLLHQGLPLALPGLLGQPQPPAGGKPQPELFQFYGAQALGHSHHPHSHHAHPGGNPALRGEKSIEPSQLLLNGAFSHHSAASRKVATLGSAPVSLSPEPAPSSPLPPHSRSDLGAPQRLFGCLVCQVFSTDSLEALVRHASAPRSLPEAEWKEVSGDLHRCRLCAYGTQLKANFQLHLKTDKHALKYQLAAHLREGGGAGAHLGAELPLGPPLHLHCNLCEYETNSKEKMRLHVAGTGHQEALQGYKFLLEMEATSPGPDPAQFRCLLCNTDTPNRLVMIQHLHSPQHRDTHGQWRLQLLQNGEGTPGLERYICFAPATPSGKEIMPETSSPEKEMQNKAQMPGSDETETKAGSVGDTTVFCCPYCNFVDQSAEAVRAHTVSQHAVQPKFRCPLCQEQLVGRTNLHFHLSHIHNVVPECVEKLLLVATTVEMTFATKVVPGLSLPPEPPKPGGTPSSEQGGGNESESPLVAPTMGEKPSPAPVLRPETPPASAASPAPSADPPEKPPPASPTPPAAAPLESEEEEPPRPNAPPEEQPLPSHTPTELPEVSPLALPSQDPRHPLSYRKATNFALDKFLDPARPYKCTVCKESFTQKNILLVHYNSVSHLHKMKKASADPSAPSRGEPGTPGALQPSSDKPYKCTTCRVSYNQSSTLEIHMRSVLHQTRSRVAKMEAAGKTEMPSAESEPPSEMLLEPEAPKLLEAGCVQVPALPFLAPSTAELQRFPTPLFTPPLLPPFPLVPESLLKLQQQQQQQLLLPFYLHDLKVAPKLALAAPALTLPTTPPVLLPPPLAKEEQAPAASSSKPEPAEETEAEETEGGQPGNEASRTAAKALLENFGFELVIQYNEGKQPAAAAPAVPPRPPAGKLQCGACGKQFSNMLILKTHEEHVHRRFLPFEALNRYAVQFRKSYDSMYPPPPPPVLPTETTTTTAAAATAAAATATETPTVTVTPASVPLEIPSLCPPFLMQPMPVVVPPPEGETSRVSPERLKSLWFRGEDEEGGGASVVLDPARGGFPTTRRFSRTKFTEFQSQALQSFFESSAYPKDGEVERLSVLLSLPNRVIVVWFQNARQKARKCGGSEAGVVSGSTATQHSCKKCRTSFRCIFELVCHLKKCYNDQPEEGEGDCAEEENEAPEEEEEEQDQEQEEEEEQQKLPATDEEVKMDGAGEKSPEEEPTAPAAPPNTSSAHPCDQSTAKFSSTDLISIHCVSHMPAAGPPPASAGPQPPLDLPSLVFGERVVHPDSSRAQKRKHEDGSLSPTGSECASVAGGDGEPPRDKRLRTTILPEQLEILYRWYMQDSNPTRKMLDCISEEVGLKKRVVQVWFQNTRARERKGQFRCSASTVNSTSKPSPALPTTFPKFSPPPREPSIHYGAAFTPSLPVTSLQPPAAKPEVPADSQMQEEPAEEEVPKENEERSLSGGELSDSSSSSSSSLADLDFSGSRRSRATGDGGIGGLHDSLGQRRYRTQMSSLQLKIMKACYEAYRTPTMQECEVLGEEIGLPKRVIQVWFQNARAKEKKAKAAIGGGGDEGPPSTQTQSECLYCEVKYDFYVSCRGHLFSRGHLARLKEAIKAQLKSESKCYELVPDKGTPSPTSLGASMPPTTVPSSLGSMAPFVPGPSSSSSSGVLSSPLASTQPGLPLPQRFTPEPAQHGSSAEPAPAPETSPSDGQTDPASSVTQEPSLSSTATLKNLKTLKAAVPALLGGQFLPFPLPAATAAAPSLFGAQLPGAYFQQLYGMKKGLFPMNPVIPQTLMGLLPSPLLPTPTPEPPVEVSEAPGISTVDVTHQYLCRQCKAAFESEGAAAAHQAAFCYFGRQPPAAPPPLRVPVCTYHCLACEVLVSGREALGAHLRSSAHRRKAGSNAATASVFAKEESKLPHSDSNPKSNATSTTLLAL